MDSTYENPFQIDQIAFYCFWNATPQAFPATVYRKGHKVILTGHGTIHKPKVTSHKTLLEHIQSANDSYHWCIKWIDMPQDDGTLIAEAIRNWSAITVSDGTYKHPYDTAAFIIEGDSPVE